MNIYHACLNIPVQFTFPQKNIPDPQFHFHCGLSGKDIPEQLIEWLDSFGLFVHHSEFFYTPPGRTLEPHIDGGKLNNKVKLNWMSGGHGSVMQWFELKEGAALKMGRTVIGTPYGRADRSDLTLMHEAVIGAPSLVNVGQIHAIRNGNHPRYVASFLLGDIQTRQMVEWDQAINIFKDYVV